MNWRYVLHELGRRRHRSLVYDVGIAIGVALFVAINAVAAAYQRAAALPFQSLGADLIVQRPEQEAAGGTAQNTSPRTMRGIRTPFANQYLTEEELTRLRQVPEVADAVPALLLWEFTAAGFRSLLGVDLAQPHLGPVRVRDWISKGRFPAAQGEVLVEKHFAKFHHLQPGSVLPVGNTDFTVVGLLDIREGVQTAAANIFLSLDEARDLGGMAGTAGNIAYVRLNNPAHLPEVEKTIPTILPRATVTSANATLQLMGGMATVSDRFVLLASLLALIGAVACILKSMQGSMVERAHEIGILKACGWTSGDVRRQLMGETLVQALLGCLLGLLGGYLTAFLLGFLTVPLQLPWAAQPLTALTREGATPGYIRLPVSFSAALIVASLGISLGSGVLAGYLAGRRSADMRPSAALRH